MECKRRGSALWRQAAGRGGLRRASSGAKRAAVQRLRGEACRADLRVQLLECVVVGVVHVLQPLRDELMRMQIERLSHGRWRQPSRSLCPAAWRRHWALGRLGLRRRRQRGGSRRRRRRRRHARPRLRWRCDRRLDRKPSEGDARLQQRFLEGDRRAHVAIVLEGVLRPYHLNATSPLRRARRHTARLDDHRAHARTQRDVERRDWTRRGERVELVEPMEQV